MLNGLDLISKTSLKDEESQTRLYIQRSKNLRNVRLQTNNFQYSYSRLMWACV